MLTIDLKANTAKLRARLAAETDPVLRRNIATVARHIECEISGDLEAVMATLVPTPVYHLFVGTLTSPVPAPKDKSRASYVWMKGDEVRKLYTQTVPGRFHWAQAEIELLVVDRHCVILEGLLQMPYPGGLLKQWGHTVDEETASYLAIGRFVNIFPFDEKTGLLLGEDFYVDPTFLDGIGQRKHNEIEFLPGYEQPVDIPLPA